MEQVDDFSAYHDELLDGRHDCVDRIVLNGYFPLGQQGGGFRTWWRALTGFDETLDQSHLQRLAGRFSRRLHAWAKKQSIPLIHCSPGERKHELAERYLPQDPSHGGLFLILVAKWVERQARRQTISISKEGNCFVGGSFPALDRLAYTLCDEHAIGRLTEVCDRWAYSSCLCFALDLDEQRRSHFHDRYSAYQIEYSRNLLFTRGTTLDAVFQGLIDRTRRHLDVPKLRTIFGYKTRPHHRQGKKPLRMARVLDQPTYDLTVFKVHFGPLTLKLYDKGARVLRVERTRRYRVRPYGIRILAGMLVLRERVLKPLLARLGKRHIGRQPKHIHPIDQHYQALQHELRLTFETLGLTA